MKLLSLICFVFLSNAITFAFAAGDALGDSGGIAASHEAGGSVSSIASSTTHSDAQAAAHSATNDAAGGLDVTVEVPGSSLDYHVTYPGHAFPIDMHHDWLRSALQHRFRMASPVLQALPRHSFTADLIAHEFQRSAEWPQFIYLRGGPGRYPTMVLATRILNNEEPEDAATLAVMTLWRDRDFQVHNLVMLRNAQHLEQMLQHNRYEESRYTPVEHGEVMNLEQDLRHFAELHVP